MKLKYYLRGLGIGMVVTALIMGIVTGEQGALTDAEIKAAALKLGMVESESLKLSDLPQETAKPDGGGTEESEEASKESEEPEVSDGESAEESAESKESEEPEVSDGESAEESAESKESEGAEASEEESTEESAESKESEGAEASEEESTEGSAESKESEGAEASDGESTEESEESKERVTFTVRSGSGSRTVCDRLEEAGLITDAAAFDSYLCNHGYSKRIGAGTFEIPYGASEEEIAGIITRSK